MGPELAGKPQAYSGRITPFIFLTCSLAASGGILFGYDLGISGGVTSMAPFLRKFFPDVESKMREARSSPGATSNYCKFDSQLLTAFTASLYFAGLLATFCASPVTRGFGSRASMILGGASFVAGAVLGGLALDVFMLILGRVLLGVGVGFTNQVIPLYLSEMAPPRHRGAINNAYDFFVGLGVFSANLINYGTQKLHSSLGWRISLSAALIPASVLTLGTLLLPDTPNSLVQRSDLSIEKATRMLQKLRGTEDVHAELGDMIAAADAARAITQRPFLAILRRRYRPQLVMAVLIPFFKQMTGVVVITFYSPVIFRMIGLGETASLLLTVVTGAIGTGSVLLAIILVDRVGRRTLFMAGGTMMFTADLIIGGVLAAKIGDHSGAISRGYACLILSFACVFMAGFGISWGPLGWLVPSEVLQLEVRSAGQSIVVAVTFLLAAINGQSMLAMLCRFKSGVFFYFGGWVFVMTAFVAALLPETKGIPIETMDRIWRRHWFWKKYVPAEEGRGEDEGAGAVDMTGSIAHQKQGSDPI